MIVPRMPEPAPDTPGLSVASCTKLRPLSGKSCTCFSSITLPRTDDWVSSSGASPSIRTVSLTSPTFQLQVDLRALIDLQLHARALDLAKTRKFRR